ncbi:MAG: hypothetical protein J6B31_07855 [Bacteroidaceae bacterium]|nr:hypothetical protein [Bacteroidaceae bacterium]
MTRFTLITVPGFCTSIEKPSNRFNKQLTNTYNIRTRGSNHSHIPFIPPST